MKKNFLNVCVLILMVIVSIYGTFVFFGCKEKDEGFLSVDDIKGLRELKEKGIVYFEWLSEYSENKPTLIVFHGEQKQDDVFKIDLDKTVYVNDVLYKDKTLEDDPFGLLGNGFRLTSDGTAYWMSDYWITEAEFNVVIFHCEKFFAEDVKNCSTKIYSDYKMRYLDDGSLKELKTEISFTEAVAALYAEEMLKVNSSAKEIRFLGNGIGANLAVSVAYYLNSAFKKGAIDEKLLPYRVTLCDPYLNNEKTTFSVSFDNALAVNEGELGIVTSMLRALNNSSVAIEIIESEEADEDGKNAVYAYDCSNDIKDSDIYSQFKKQGAYLALSESYSKNQSFDEYKFYKRIAFDWYIYSVIGSDNTEKIEGYYESSNMGTDDRLSAGYPHTLKEYREGIYGVTNWGTNYRRPILNNRIFSNDIDPNIGATRGINFGVGAWTPTAYIKALCGTSFTQQEAYAYDGELNIYGSRKYLYRPYVLKVFRTENFQYADRNDYTLVTGRIYFDENENASMDDGIKHGMRSELFFNVYKGNESDKILSETITTDANGYYCIILKDALNDAETFDFSGTDGNYTLTGMKFDNEEYLMVELSLLCPKKYTAAREPSKEVYYTAVNKHNFYSNGKITIAINTSTVHSVLIRNCLPKKV